MSELDLIRKLEKLKEDRPQKEWVNFTKESILASNPKIQKQGISLFIEKFDLLSFAPMMVCIFVALIFGSFINLFESEDESMLTAKSTNIERYENLSAGLIKVSEVKKNPDIPAKAPERIASAEDVQTKSDPVYSFSDDLKDMEINKEDLSKEVENRIERIRIEVGECKKLEKQGFLEADENSKERCKGLEDQLNYFEKILNNKE